MYLKSIERSSSQGEIGVLSQIRPLELPEFFYEKKRPAAFAPVAKPAPKPAVKEWKWKKPQVVQKREKPKGGILTLGSPERETSSRKEKAEVGFCEFLKACSLCKKKLVGDKDIFMYGYLSAFCSPECRDDRMALDGYEKIPFESTKKKMSASKKYAIRQIPEFGN